MKKLIILFLSVILLLAAVPAVSVSAAKEPAFVVSKEQADAGDTVKITVSTKNNPGIISMKLLVKYDAAALQLTEAKDGKFKNVAFSSTDSNPFIINWIDSIHPNNSTNGTVATLVFKVLDTAPEGKSEISLSYDPDDVFEMTSSNEFVNVNFATQNGYVDITNPNASSTTSQEQEPDHDRTGSSSNTQTSSNAPDSTYSQILEQIYESAVDESSSDNTVNTGGGDSDTNEEQPQNSWIIWVVIAAVVLLGGAFAVVIIKSKRDK